MSRKKTGKSIEKRIERFEQKQREKQEARTARINERFRQIERRTETPENTTAYRYARQELGQEKPRYTESIRKLMSEDIDRLYEQALGTSRKLASKSASLSGINYIEEKRVSGAIKGIKENLGIEIEDTPEFRRFLKENANEMIENDIGSDVIFEMFAMAMHKEKGIDILLEKWEDYQRQGSRVDTIALKKWLK